VYKRLIVIFLCYRCEQQWCDTWGAFPREWRLYLPDVSATHNGVICPYRGPIRPGPPRITPVLTYKTALHACNIPNHSTRYELCLILVRFPMCL